MYKRIAERISQFFFQSSTSTNLGICRFLFFGIIFIIYHNEDFSYWGNVPDILWRPIVVFRYLHIPVLSSEILYFLTFIWLGSLLLSSIGLFSRLSTILAFVLGSYLLGLVNSFARLQHMENLMVLVLGVMAFSHCGNCFSLDRWLKDKGWLYKSGQNSKVAQGIEGEYTWPIRLIWVLMTLAFCAAGVSKLRNSGLEWITSDYLANLFVTIHFIGARGEPLIDWMALWLANKPIICHSLAGMTVILEVCAPLALFHFSLRVLIVPSLFFMVLGIWIVLGTPFPLLLTCFLFWVPWDRIIDVFKEHRIQIGQQSLKKEPGSK